MSRTCPYCLKELKHEEHFERLDSHQNGDIYTCTNRKCKHYKHNFCTFTDDATDQLHVGYPL